MRQVLDCKSGIRTALTKEANLLLVTGLESCTTEEVQLRNAAGLVLPRRVYIINGINGVSVLVCVDDAQTRQTITASPSVFTLRNNKNKSNL